MIKENKRINKYLDLAGELRKLWNMGVMVIPILLGLLGTVLKSLGERVEELKIKGSIETL